MQMKLIPSPNDFRRIFIVLAAVSVGYFFFLWFMVNQNHAEPNFKDRELTDNGGLILDTPGCKIPLLNPYDKSIRHLLAPSKIWKCPGKPSPLITLPKGILILNELVLKRHYKLTRKSISCSYKPIIREPEPKGKFRENFISLGASKHIQFGKPVSDDLLFVSCALGSKTFTQFIASTPLKPDVEKIKSSRSPAGELNVILVAIDSVSKLNFLRHFKKTYSFLLEHLRPYEFRGHTKLGENTFPNLIPLLTGHFVEHYWNESVRNTMFFDGIDLIWKKYSEMGYRTLYAEDSPNFGAFNYAKRGFLNPPTDYYYRPMAIAIQNSKLKQKSARYCINSQLESDIIYKYLENFVATMDSRPYFAFAMISSITHDRLNDAGYADMPTYRLLNRLLQSGALNKSLLVFFSDHGIRFGKIRETFLGKFEERMPFMFMNFPVWFLRKYPHFARNLRDNQYRLTTHFDIHATLVHALNTTGRLPGKPIATPNGMSLLEKISVDRTCKQAKILTHFCPCQVYQPIPISNPEVIKASAAVVHSINKHLEPYRNICAILELDKVLEANLGQANDKVLSLVKPGNSKINQNVIYGKLIGGLKDYLITLRMKKSGALFESTVRHDLYTNNFNVLGISRINAYGDQSICLESQALRIYCYCKS